MKTRRTYKRPQGKKTGFGEDDEKGEGLGGRRREREGMRDLEWRGECELLLWNFNVPVCEL